MPVKRKPVPVFDKIPCMRCNGTGLRALPPRQQGLLRVIYEQGEATSQSVFQFRETRKIKPNSVMQISTELRNLWKLGYLHRYFEQNGRSGEFIYVINPDGPVKTHAEMLAEAEDDD